jgi:hypothetical protein
MQGFPQNRFSKWLNEFHGENNLRQPEQSTETGTIRTKNKRELWKSKTEQTLKQKSMPMPKRGMRPFIEVV